MGKSTSGTNSPSHLATVLLVSTSRIAAWLLVMDVSSSFTACLLKINVTLLSRVKRKTTKKPAQSASPATAEHDERCINKESTWRHGWSMLTIFKLREMQRRVVEDMSRTDCSQEKDQTRESECSIDPRVETQNRTKVWCFIDLH